MTELVEGEDSDCDSDATARTSSGESLSAMEAIAEAEHAAEAGTDALGMPLLVAHAEDSAPLSEHQTTQSKLLYIDFFEPKLSMGTVWLACSLQLNASHTLFCCVFTFTKKASCDLKLAICHNSDAPVGVRLEDKLSRALEQQAALEAAVKQS